jgi:cytochrome c553
MLRIAALAAFLAGATQAWSDTMEEKAALCGACHGLKGVPEDPTTPIIWGQSAGYLYLQFRDFQKGARKDYRMTPIAQYVVKQDAVALAEYFTANGYPLH